MNHLEEVLMCPHGLCCEVVCVWTHLNSHYQCHPEWCTEWHSETQDLNGILRSILSIHWIVSSIIFLHFIFQFSTHWLCRIGHCVSKFEHFNFRFLRNQVLRVTSSPHRATNFPHNHSLNSWHCLLGRLIAPAVLARLSASSLDFQMLCALHSQCRKRDFNKQQQQ